MKVVLFFLIFISGSLSAQSVFLDNTFGNNGIVTVSGTTVINETAITEENDIISVGYTIPNKHITLTKHHTDGSIDLNFGTTGVVHHEINFSSEAKDLVLSQDGKIIVIGTTYLSESQENSYEHHTFISRFKSNGELDSNFATNGTFSSSVNIFPRKVFINDDNSILISASTLNGAVLFKLTEDGIPDVNMGVDGIKVLSTPGFVFNGSSAIKLNDGNILFVGTDATESNNYKISCQKLDSNGELVNSFGENGRFIYDGYTGDLNWEYLLTAAERTDGKIVLSGYMGGSRLVMITANGNIDSEFGKNGVMKDVAANNEILIQNDNRILLGDQSSSSGNNFNIFLTRRKSEGLLDPTFNHTGYYTLNPGVNDLLYSFKLIDSTHLLVAGTTSSSTFGPNTFLLARLDISQTFITENTQSNEVFVYPNPSSDRLFIHGPKPNQVSITSMIGIELLDLQYNHLEGIRLNQLSSGSYIISYFDQERQFHSEVFQKY